MIRFKKYLVDKGLWDDEKDEALYEESKEQVLETFKKVEHSGLVSLEDIFKYTYEEMTPNLIEQYQAYKRFLEKDGK